MRDGESTDSYRLRENRRREEATQIVYNGRVGNLFPSDLVRRDIELREVLIGQPNLEFQAICQKGREEFGNTVQIIPALSGPLDKVNNQVTPLLKQRMRWINETGQVSNGNREMFYRWRMVLWFHLHREFSLVLHSTF